MRNLARLGFAAVVVPFLLWMSGCSEDSSDPTPPTPPGDVEFDPDVEGAVAEAFLFRTPTGPGLQGEGFILLSDPGDASDGAVPASGVALQIVDATGRTVASSQSAGDGEFRFESLPNGSLTLVADDGARRMERSFSGIPGATIDLGYEPAISREDAIAAIRSEFDPTFLVLGVLQPLPSGSIVYPSDYALNGEVVPADAVIRISTPTWLFYLDPEYDARFAHGVVYVTVDATDGEVTIHEEPTWPPAINHTPTWRDEVEYLTFTGVDPGDFDPEDIPDGADFEPHAEVIQLPDELLGFRPGPLPYDNFFQSPGPNSDTFVILVQGDFGSSFEADVRNMNRWFLGHGIPSSQIAVINLSEVPWALPSDTRYKTKFEEFNGIIRQRLEDEGRQSTLIVYVTAHGEEKTAGFFAEHTDVQFTWRPNHLCLPESRACRLRVFLDMCYADQFGGALAAMLGEHDYRIASSSRADETSRMVQMANHLRTGKRLGSRFTNAVTDRANFADNDITGIYPESDGDILTDHPGLTRQTPQLRSQTLTPEWCQGLPAIGVCCFTDGSCRTVFRQEDCDGFLLADVTSCDPDPCIGACCVGEECLPLASSDCVNVSGLFLGIGSVCDPNPCPGACCNADGSCVLLAQAACNDSGGAFRGIGSDCDPNPCPQPGACCLADGSCFVASGAENCDGGSYLGNGTGCDPNPCPQPGACCRPNGTCFISPQADCDLEYLGNGTVCDPNSCPQPGACCFEIGDCSVLSRAQCGEQEEASFLGAGTSCEPNPCPQPPEGACCWGVSDERCTVRSQLRCERELGGNYLGDGTTCFSEPCTDPLAGACCLEAGRCEFLREASCDGDFKGVGVACSPEICDFDEQGACCFELGSCRLTASVQCTGDYQGDGTSCDPNPCPQPGACCFPSGTCQILDESPCTGQGGQYLAGTTCDPNPCGTGACCDEASCTITLAALCDGEFQGVGIDCDPNPCSQPTGACCIGSECSVTEAGLCDGEYQGDDATCDPNPCDDEPKTGACCIGTSCTVVPSGQCEGSYQGDGSGCDPDPCAAGACCVDETCSVTGGEEVCDGEYQGDGTTCDPDPCQNEPGACCVGDECSIEESAAACINRDGAWLGVGTECAPSICQDGVCCIGEECSLTFGFSCDGDHFPGQDSCDPNPCLPLGACCLTAGECRMDPEEDCAGFYLGDGTACEPSPCEALGACCLEITCVLVPSAEDCAGDYWGPGIYCPSDEMCPTGVCCTIDDCVVTTPPLCDGTFILNGVCEPTTCHGACCTVTEGCTVRSQFACMAEFGEFHGVGSTCDPDPCPPLGACCTNGECELVEASQCSGGIWLGEGTDCDSPLICLSGACCVDLDCFVTPNEMSCEGDYLGDGTVCEPGICEDFIAFISEYEFGVTHGQNSSDLCLRLLFDAGERLVGAVVEVEFTGASNEGIQIGEIGNDGSCHLSHPIFFYGGYNYQVLSVQSREVTYELGGAVTGEQTVGESEVPCSR